MQCQLIHNMYVVEKEMRNVKGGVPDTKAIFFWQLEMIIHFSSPPQWTLNTAAEY